MSTVRKLPSIVTPPAASAPAHETKPADQPSEGVRRSRPGPPPPARDLSGQLRRGDDSQVAAQPQRQPGQPVRDGAPASRAAAVGELDDVLDGVVLATQRAAGSRSTVTTGPRAPAGTAARSVSRHGVHRRGAVDVQHLDRTTRSSRNIRTASARWHQPWRYQRSPGVAPPGSGRRRARWPCPGSAPGTAAAPGVPAAAPAARPPGPPGPLPRTGRPDGAAPAGGVTGRRRELGQHRLQRRPVVQAGHVGQVRSRPAARPPRPRPAAAAGRSRPHC